MYVIVVIRNKNVSSVTDIGSDLLTSSWVQFFNSILNFLNFRVRKVTARFTKKTDMKIKLQNKLLK